jgi:hypothetical protein
MILVYQTIPEKEIRSMAKEAVEKISAWFKANPKKRICKAGLWYGKVAKIRKGYVQEDIDAAVQVALKKN